MSRTENLPLITSKNSFWHYFFVERPVEIKLPDFGGILKNKKERTQLRTSDRDAFFFSLFDTWGSGYPARFGSAVDPGILLGVGSVDPGILLGSAL